MFLPGTWGRSLSSRPISVERLSCCIVDLVKLLLQVWVFPTSHHTAAAGRGPTGTSWSPANFSVLWSSSSETSRAKRPTPPDPVSVVSHTPSQVTEVRGKMFFFTFPGAAAGTGEPALNLNGSPAKAPYPDYGRARSCTSHIPSSTSEPVQTQQPCSLKGSLSSDNIYAGLHADGTSTPAAPVPGECGRLHSPEKWLSANICSCVLVWNDGECSVEWAPLTLVVFLPLWTMPSTGWSNYPQPSERVSHKSSSKPRARFLSGPVSLSICLYLFSSAVASRLCSACFHFHVCFFCLCSAGFSVASPHDF